MPADGALLSMQRAFFAALREPIHGESRERARLPERAGAVSPRFGATARALIAPSATLGAVERLELYHRQYWYRLLDSVAEDFPMVRWFLGDTAFWHLIEAYLEATPTTSFTLRHLGAGLAAFAARRLDLASSQVHVAELARLDYAMCHAFEAAERSPIEPAMLATAALALQPHVTLLACRTPVDTLWRQASAGTARGVIGPPAQSPRRFVVIHRRGEVLELESVPRPAHTILAAIADTGSLDAAMASVAASEAGVALRERAVARWFRVWTERRWICQRDPERALASHSTTDGVSLHDGTARRASVDSTR